MGLLDRPIDKIEEDTLKLGEHAEALARFIRNCDTAMTIAIQGDWGSGKTSMMRMIEHKLDGGSENERIRKRIRINTWELAQFGQSENLPILLLSAMVDGLSDSQKTGKSASVRKWLGVLGRTTAVAVGTALGQGEAVKAGMDHAAAEVAGEPLDMVYVVREMKKELVALVGSVTGSGDGARVVVFIDDLDRLVPIRAVELLEVMKVFLDVPGCVFVLACDYQVVMKGLTQKFGVSEAQLSGKSFFDKIIQVPYCMPLHRYDVEQYMKAILRVVTEEDVSDADINLYRGLTETSVGFNPRGLKRIMNALILMNEVTLNDRDELPDNPCRPHERIRILFAILCLQQSYPALFRLMCEQNELSHDWLRDLNEENLKGDPELQRLVKKDGAPDPDWQAMADFCTHFFNAVQLESDGSRDVMSAAEIKVLQKLLDNSNIVASAPAPAKNRALSYGEFREKFLGKWSQKAESLAFFEEAFKYLEALGGRIKPGTAGVSVRDEGGVARMHMYPPESRKGPLYFVYRDDVPEMWKRAGALSPGLQGQFSGRTSFRADPKDLGDWKGAEPIFEILFGGGGAAAS
jgi:hypothetical protein